MKLNEDVILRKTQTSDFEYFFRFQLDKEAIQLAAFTPEDPTNRKVLIDKWTRLLMDPTINMQTILYANTIVGSISKFIMEGEAEITYWLDKKFWGQGIASTALKKFLLLEKTRPVYGRVAFDNYGSQTVLKKSGFVKIGMERAFANARQTEIEEFIYQLVE